MKKSAKTQVVRHTVYMTNPGKFLDLFYTENKDKSEKRKLKLGKKIGRALLLITSIGIVFAVISITTAHSPEHQLNELFRKKEYIACLQLAEELLRSAPRNEKVSAVGRDAFEKTVIKNGWAEKIDRGRFSDARSILARTTEPINHNHEALKIMRIFQWISDLEAYSRARMPEMPFVILRDENRIQRIIDGWDSDKIDIRTLLNRIADDLPEGFQQRIYSNLSMIQTDRLLYFDPVMDLNKTIQSQIHGNNPDGMLLIIEEFRRKFPCVGGIEALKADIVGKQNNVGMRETENES